MHVIDAKISRLSQSGSTGRQDKRARDKGAQACFQSSRLLHGMGNVEEEDEEACRPPASSPRERSIRPKLATPRLGPSRRRLVVSSDHQIVIRYFV
jgi:hypothetical protein